MTAIALAELAAPRTRLRITRRGRIVLAGIVAAPLVVGIFATALGGAAATATSTNAAPASITVEAGQSLWQIAALVAPEANPADVVADIIAVNDLAGGSVQPGQSLVLPAAYAD
ncbi:MULTISPECIES: LysM peptidoglycan-binding domain-containing protein [unclassified Microcella]|uniref:LysM peptidoglycan-binding domain-containing protein n=1 Tax=unclassified Microcella TaxID=2630066 RepID=UPI0006FD8BCB|nr:MULTISPECIES: LysM peptidoglycan-binding domain-containing protein [unclassified Microcella]KQV26703.1 hypothetical protein ASC54_07615 [Yonghaparkia sp. Root332]KRF32527.1 hypothetical protein ASG83_00150 [Yonghaparkia sp. Soil809]